MTPPRGIDVLLDALPPIVLVGGKGGVGKTTCAAALALAAARRGEPTLLVSTDPARALPDALGAPVGATPMPLADVPALHAAQLDTAVERDRFLGRWRETIAEIVDRGTYLDRDDIDGLVDAALPGADETFAALALADLAGDARWTRVIVDTAPTGHTLRLLALPDTFAGLVRLLDTMQGKHRFMVQALTHRYRGDAADAFLAEMGGRVDALQRALGLGPPSSPGDRHAAAVLVARAEPIVVAETARYAAALAALGVRVAAVVVNAVGGEGEGGKGIANGPGEMSAQRALATIATGAPHFTVRRLAEPPMGLPGLEIWTSALIRSGGAGIGDGDPATSSQIDLGGGPPSPLESPDLTTLAPALTIVGGKGGVGKTTVACALAVSLAAADAPILLVSTDPAPSVGDALGLEIGDDETEVPGVPGLVARQMDAAAAFDRLRAEYQSRVDAVFDGLMGGALDAAHDRAVVRDLLRLAPPGVDELYALALLGDTLAEARFARVIVDPAPTGHLLRLLEMPALALDWSHRLMRLMLKYKEAAPLGEAAGELLAFAKRTRAIGELLRDASRSAVVVVTLDEPLVRAETARLLAAVEARGVRANALVWNRVRAQAPLEVGEADRHLPSRLVRVTAPLTSPAPRGAEALRAWARRWRALPSSTETDA